MKAFGIFLTLFFAFTLVAANTGLEQVFKRGAIRSGEGDATFFKAHHLKNSGCYGRNGLPRYDARSTDLIGAMNMNGLQMCYECLKVTNKKNGKSVVVKIIDLCVGCKKNRDVDLTERAFSQIANLSEGRIKMKWKACACPRNGKFPKFEQGRRR